jgi:S1-C subfamily serine protease
MMAPMAAQKKSLYEILGIARDANSIDIGLAYERRKAELQRAVPQDASAMALAHQAHEILSNPKRRAAYDASLVTQAEKAAAAEQESPDLVLESDEDEEKPRRKYFIPAGLAALVAVIAAGFIVTRHDAPKAPVIVVEAPKPPPPPPPPPRPLGPEQILPAALLSIGQVMSYEMSGRAVPVGLAFAVEPSRMITTCHGVPAGGKLVVKVDKESMSADLAETDEELDLCRLAVQGLNVRPLTIAAEEAKAGDKVYTLGVNSAGEYALTEGTVKQTRIVGGTKVLDLSMPVNANSSGGAVLDVYGRLVGIATTPHRYGGGPAAISSGWISQMRSRARTTQ